MKKITITLFTLLLLVVTQQIKAQYVTIPDAKFVAWLQVHIPTAMSGNQMDTTSAAVTTLTAINVENDSIGNLTGIQYFDSLKTLDCGNTFFGQPHNNYLTAIPRLPSTLDTLICCYNTISNITTLPNTLKFLKCVNNHLSHLPALPSSLNHIDLYQNFFSSLPTLPNSITYLDCSSNPLLTLPTLPNSLVYLNCNGQRLTSVPALPNTLTTLNLSFNKITCFPAFPNSITNFNISNNLFDCLPNYIAAMDAATMAYPLCATGDTNGCALALTCAPAVHYNLMKDTTQLYTWNAYPTYSSNAANATWYWGDNTSTQGLYPTHTYSVAGKYNIQVTAFATCGDSATYSQNDSIFRLSYSSNSIISVNVINPVLAAITKFSAQSTIQIYPNPTQNNFTIETTNIERQTISVFDVNGKLVLLQTINGTTNIDASNLAQGVYNINVSNNMGVANKRLVIVK